MVNTLYLFMYLIEINIYSHLNNDQTLLVRSYESKLSNLKEQIQSL